MIGLYWTLSRCLNRGRKKARWKNARFMRSCLQEERVQKLKRKKNKLKIKILIVHSNNV